LITPQFSTPLTFSWNQALRPRVPKGFLAGRTEESTPEEMLLVIHRLLHLLPPDYQARLANHSEEAASEAARKC